MGKSSWKGQEADDKSLEYIHRGIARGGGGGGGGVEGFSRTP